MVERDPNDWRAVMGLANSLLGLSQPEAALEFYTRAAELSAQSFEVHFNRAAALAALGRTEEAIQSLRRGLALEPGHIDARLRLAALLAQQGRFGEAIACLRAGLELSPGEARLTQALALHLSSAPEAALRDGREALRLMQSFEARDPMAKAVRLDTMAMARAEMGDFEAALESGRAAIAIFEELGEQDWAREARERLALYERKEAYRE